MSEPLPPPPDTTLVHIEGEAYDVAVWAKKHPGGEVLLRFLGKDATAVFAAFHGRRAKKTLRGFRVSDEVPDAPPLATDDPVERDFFDLRERAAAAGRFVASHRYFLKHGAITLGLVFTSVALLAWVPMLWPIAALALGLGWQQGGWLAHDLAHHSVFEDRRVGDRFSLALGGVVLGFSGDWWKRKHNVHHALTNVRGDDPDIDVLPLLSFDERDLVRAGRFTRFVIRIQPWTALPVLAFARVNWAAQGLLWAAFARDVKRRGWELGCIALHYAWTAAMLSLVTGWGTRLAFYAIAQLASGLMIGSVFLVGHNSRPIIEKSEAPGFHALQVLTTQNIRTHWTYRWFFGGLERQIEHHLFPTMPRHHHDGVAAEVRELCGRHGLDYVERGFFRGLWDVYGVMLRVARGGQTA